jgi:uncharacterized protein
MCYTCIDHNDYFNLLQACESHGLKVNYIPQIKPHKGCMVNTLNAFIIGPNGEMYKCWDDVNHPERIIGNIKDNEISNKRLFLHYQISTSPFSNDECKNCLIFPSCSGACGYFMSRNLISGGQYDLCPIYKDHHILEDALIKSLNNHFQDGKYDISI